MELTLLLRQWKQWVTLLNPPPEFQKQLKMSAAAQERFNNKMRVSKVMMESGLDELLTEMFGLLSKLITVLTPLFKLLAWTAKKFTELFKVIGDNGVVVATTAVTVALAAALNGWTIRISLRTNASLVGHGCMGSAWCDDKVDSRHNRIFVCIQIH